MMDQATPPPHFSGQSPSGDLEAHTWRPLGYFNIYRFSLATLFVILYQLDQLPRPLGSAAPHLFVQTSFVFLLFSLFFQVAITRRAPSFTIQRNFQISVDIVLITLLIHASGGLSSGVSMLLVISVANYSMLSMGRGPALFAALSTLAVLLQQGYSFVTSPDSEINFPFAGMLGATLFATALLTNILARRAIASEALAKQRGIDLANMAQLTEYVIQQMETGVVVLDHDNDLRFLNSSAWQLLGTPTTPYNTRLEVIAPALQQAVDAWQQQRPPHPPPFRVAPGTTELIPRFIPIGSERDSGLLIFLSDAKQATRHAQQLKLASLGRLTASIAHEVRNPLGAISHAGQLLAESPDIAAEDHRLTEIIQEQSRRINTMVENILQLGRQREGNAEPIELTAFLHKLYDNIEHICSCSQGEVALEMEEEAMTILFDATQLMQILTNLAENGLRHARAAGQGVLPLVTIRLSRQREKIYLDVIDRGPGVAEADQGNIFEPFFTTESSGTGLGLYISREMANNGGAQLDYLPTDDAMSRFRLTFRDNDYTEPRG